MRPFCLEFHIPYRFQMSLWTLLRKLSKTVIWNSGKTLIGAHFSMQRCATANKSCQRSCSKAESSVPGEISESIQSRTSKIITRTSQRTTGKGYTTEELEAALQDIQSGKLGTRRAAVRYPPFRNVTNFI